MSSYIFRAVLIRPLSRVVWRCSAGSSYFRLIFVQPQISRLIMGSIFSSGFSAILAYFATKPRYGKFSVKKSNFRYRGNRGLSEPNLTGIV